MKHPKTYINQINKDQTERTHIKNNKEKTANNTQGDYHKDNSRSLGETFQDRMECQDILKMMKEKSIQPRLLYAARISFKYEGKIKRFYREEKAEKIQHHQTSSPTNAKGSSLDRKHRKHV